MSRYSPATNLQDKGNQVHNVDAYGAVGNGIANDTAPILEALADAQVSGKPLYLPRQYLISGVGTELLLITKAIRILGAGMRKSKLIIANSVGATTDVIRYAPPGSDEAFGFGISDLGIVAQSGNPARHALNIDVTTNTALSFAARLMLERVWIGNDGTEFGGRAVEVTNPTLKNPAMFTADIDHCQIYGGIRLIGASDSVSIDRSVLSGANCGLEADLTSGAAELSLTRCNITSKGGAAWIKRSVHTIIAYNYVEAMGPLVGGSGNAAYIDLAGNSAAPMTAPEVHSNQISILSAAGVVDGVRVGYATNASVLHNSGYLENAGSFFIRVTTGASGTRYGNNRLASGSLGGLLTNTADTTLQTVPHFPVVFPGSVSTGAPWFTGPAKFNESNHHVGSTIASAATIAPPAQGGNIFPVSGTTAITNITARRIGDWLILIPTGAWSLGSTGNIKANAAVRTVDWPVHLVYNGTSWFEVGRTA